MSEWISVEEANPDPTVDDSYLVVMPIKYAPKIYSTYIVDYNGGVWAEKGVTHWMPLPEPPKEEL